MQADEDESEEMCTALSVDSRSGVCFGSITDEDDAIYHSSKLEQLMKEKGELTLSVVQCMTFGPPRIGKTCVKDRLAGKKPKGKPAKIEGGKVVYPKEVSCSTGAAEDVLKLIVEPCEPLTFQEQEEQWIHLGFNEEVISLVKGLESLLDPTTTCSKSSTTSNELQFSDFLDSSTFEEILVNESLSIHKDPQTSNTTEQVESSPGNHQVEASTANSQVESSPVNSQVEASTANSQVEASPANNQVEASTANSQVETSPGNRHVELSLANSQVEVSTANSQVESSPTNCQVESNSQVDVSTANSQVESSAANNQVDVSTANSLVEDSWVESSTSNRQVEASTANGHVESSPASRQVEASTNNRQVEASTNNHLVEASTNNCQVEASTANGQVESSPASRQVEASTANSQIKHSSANDWADSSTANDRVEFSTARDQSEPSSAVDQLESSSTSEPVQSTPNINPLQTVKDAFLHGDPSSVTAMFEGSLTIYFTDTGGQPEFQEVLPALVSGPSLFFLTFSLANGLNHQFEVRYDSSDEEIEPYMSSFTVMDTMLQCLSSIACIGTQRKQGGEIKVIKPKVFFIGTQRDLVNDDQVHNIDRELREAIDQQGFMEMVEPHSQQQLLFAVNNYSKEDENFKGIRKAVHEVARREEEIYKVSLPAPFVTLDFYLRQPKEHTLTPEVCQNTAKKHKTTVDTLKKFVHSRHKQIKSTHQTESADSVDLTDPKTLAFVAQTLFEPFCAQLPVEVESLREALLELNELSHCREDVITMEQFKTIAKECKITAEECKEALWALHHLLGTLRHFAVGDLKDLVITNPQLFFSVVTKLITSTFTLKRNRKFLNPAACMQFHEKGFFTMDDLNKVWSQEKSHLSSEHLVTLLTYLHIIAPMEYEGKTGYFLPCVLTHAPRNDSDIADRHIVAPLLVSFDCGFTPKGIFSGLLAYLLQHAGEDGLLWRLRKAEKLFRDQASLYVKPWIYLTITARPDFIRFSMHQEKQIDFHGVCTAIKAVIEKGLNEVASRLNYTISAQPRFGFECTCYDQKLHFTKYESCDTECVCSINGVYCDIPSDYLIWFEGSPTVPSASLSEEQQLLLKPLDITDLDKVFEIVRPLTDWVGLGLSLGLHYPTLSKIEHDHYITDICKRDMLAAWLQQQDGVSQRGVPSLSRLKAALRRMGENAIANKISL